MSENSDDDTVRKEAERWFARRRDPSIAEDHHEEFERWRGQNPQRAAAYERTEQLWAKLEILKHSQRLRLEVPELNVSDGAMRRSMGFTHGRVRWLIAVAASLATLAVVSVLWLNRSAPAQIFATRLGEQRTETLADGTILRLNTDSALEVRITKRHRAVTLSRGEVDFDVARDPTRPFEVNVGDGTITVVGTHFDVRREDDSVSVTLQDGRVYLARPARREVEWLDPGQQASYSDKASGIVRRNVDVEAVMSWTGGRLEFRGTPLKEAVKEINRYSARKIQIGDRRISELAVSGTFRTGDVEGVVAAFEAAFPVRAQAGDGSIILYSR